MAFYNGLRYCKTIHACTVDEGGGALPSSGPLTECLFCETKEESLGNVVTLVLGELALHFTTSACASNPVIDSEWLGIAPLAPCRVVLLRCLLVAAQGKLSLLV